MVNGEMWSVRRFCYVLVLALALVCFYLGGGRNPSMPAIEAIQPLSARCLQAVSVCCVCCEKKSSVRNVSKRTRQDTLYMPSPPCLALPSPLPTLLPFLLACCLISSGLHNCGRW
jgi:hypothetical protein